MAEYTIAIAFDAVEKRLKDSWGSDPLLADGYEAAKKVCLLLRSTVNADVVLSEGQIQFLGDCVKSLSGVSAERRGPWQYASILPLITYLNTCRG